MNQHIQHYPNAIPKSEIARLIGPKPNPIVLEIGCNDGTDSIEILNAIPGVHLHCFEPDPRPFERFQSRYEQFNPTRVRVPWTLSRYRLAIGNHDGTTTFHQSGGPAGHMRDWDLSGSIHQPTGHLLRSPEIRFEHQIEVLISKLDTWFVNHLQPNDMVDFIWADVQGAEGDMIRGGTETLKRTRWLYSEFYQNPLYATQPNLPQIMELLGPDWCLMATYGGENFLAINRNV